MSKNVRGREEVDGVVLIGGVILQCSMTFNLKGMVDMFCKRKQGEDNCIMCYSFIDVKIYCEDIEGANNGTLSSHMIVSKF